MRATLLLILFHALDTFGCQQTENTIKYSHMFLSFSYIIYLRFIRQLNKVSTHPFRSVDASILQLVFV